MGNGLYLQGFGPASITSAAFATDSLTKSAIHGEAAAKCGLGIMVERAAAAVPQTAAGNLFTIAGGHVVLTAILGIVTVVIGAVANATKLKLDSTGAGATTDICGTVELNAAAVNSILHITGTFVDAMVKTVNLPISGLQASPVVLPPGSLQLDCAGNDGGTGRIKWIAFYFPLETGATLVAA